MRRQQRAALQQGPGAGQRAGDPRPRLRLRMDRGAALDAPGGDRHRSEGEMVPSGRRRCSQHEPQYPARQGLGRRHDRALPERRAHQSLTGLSDAAPAARLRGQHERQMAAPDQADRSAGNGHQRDHAIHHPNCGPEILAVQLPARGQVLHHPSVARSDAERPGLLRDFRPRLFGQQPDRAGLWSLPTAARAMPRPRSTSRC